MKPGEKTRAKNRKAGGAFLSGDNRGQWSKAQGRASHPSAPTASPTHPSSGAVVPKTTLRLALSASELLAGALSGDTWHGWRALLLAAMGEDLKPEELETFRRLTERQEPPKEPVSELVAVVGRRGGKSRAIATLLCYLACLVDYKARLATGETGVALCIAPSQEQAKIVLDYASGILAASPILRQLVRRSTSETIELTNRVVISVRSASYRRLRGQTCIACIADEAAFWFNEDSSNPDYEILNAVRPSLATTGGLLCVISSPYSRRGVLWDSFKNHFGPNGNPSILVAKAATRELNPSLSQQFIDREYEKDPLWAAAEYGAEFRTDIQSFITSESVEACIDPGIRERPYDRRNIYSAFIDPSGGASDSFTLAIAHKEGMSSVLDAVREIRPHAWRFLSPAKLLNERNRVMWANARYVDDAKVAAGLSIAKEHYGIKPDGIKRILDQGGQMHDCAIIALEYLSNPEAPSTRRGVAARRGRCRPARSNGGAA